MASLLYYEDVKEGDEIDSLTKKPTKRQLVEWAGASGDFNEVHYDKDYAQQEGGLPGVIVHGRLKAAFLTQLLTDWIGEKGRVRMFSVQYRRIDFPDKVLMCKGKVKGKWEEDGEYCVECQIWIENEDGEVTVEGNAIVNVPARNQ